MRCPLCKPMLNEKKFILSLVHHVPGKIPPCMRPEFLPSPMLSVTQFLKFPLLRQLPETHNTHSGINALEPQLSFGCQENSNINLSLELLQDLPILPAALISTLEASESSWTY